MRPSIDEQLEIIKRGVVELISEEELRRKLKKSEKTGKPLKIKLGFDPTAPDIHLGTAVVLRKLREFQDLGHEVIIIIGDFTAMIGDPSGRSKTRPQLTEEEVKENARTYEEQYCKILDPEKTRVTFNSQWLGKMTFADVIKLTAKITVARTIERDDFQERLKEGAPIGLHEMLYPVCQAYDSVVLGSDVEMGGTDQKFNILMGRDLQRSFDQEPQIALLMPLLVGTDGVQKMSKSLGNYIGIDEPAFEMFSKVMSIPDNIMIDYFVLATGVPMSEVEKIKSDLENGKVNPMEIKKRLGREIVSIYHSPKDAQEAQLEFEKIYSQRELPEEMPALLLKPDDLKEGKIWSVKLLRMAGMAATNTEARNLIAQGGMQINGEKVLDPIDITVSDGDVIKVGRRYARIKL